MAASRRAPPASQGSADPPEHLRERLKPSEYARGPHDEADVPKRGKTGGPLR